MLRTLVVALLLANLGWLAWSQGALRGLGLGPEAQAAPEALAREVRPETLSMRPLTEAPAPTIAAPASEAATAAAPASAPDDGAACLQAGTFDEGQAAALRAAATALPAGTWRIDPVQLPGRWMVYVGRLADAEAVRARRAELRELGLDVDRPGAALEPGLSLGRFSSEEGAARALAELGRKGVDGARVVQERRDTPAYVLRVPQAGAALRPQLAALRPALAGKDLRACD